MNFVEKTLHTRKKYFEYVEKGKGKLILLVHGWPENWASWTKQILFLSKLGYRVVAINVRGYADSYSPTSIENYKLKFFMEDIIDIIDSLGEKSAILIGHDWGAPICWTTAAYFKKKVSAVIGLSVPFTRRGKISSTKLWQELYKNIFFYQNYFQIQNIPEKELEENIEHSLLKIYYWCSEEGFVDKIKSSINLESRLLDGIPLPKRNRLKWLNKSVLSKLTNDFKKSGFKGSLNRYRAQNIDWLELKELDYLKISQPSIFIGGEHDPVRKFIKDYDAFKNAGKYCDNYKGTYIIKNCGHWVQQESSKEVNVIIRSFLKEIS
ncbi:MAG: epoxide hydrolase [Rickettsiales bacterium]|nr:epoxide hydrolase [Rickettsiales bacterium]